MDYKPQKIDCPVCGSPIFFDVSRLMMGESFACSNCKSAVSLSSSCTNVVKQAMQKYEKISMKQSVNEQKNRKP